MHTLPTELRRRFCIQWSPPPQNCVYCTLYLGANAVCVRRIALIDHALHNARLVHGGRTTQRERKRVHRTDVPDEDVLNVGRLATHLGGERAGGRAGGRTDGREAERAEARTKRDKRSLHTERR